MKKQNKKVIVMKVIVICDKKLRNYFKTYCHKRL